MDHFWPFYGHLKFKIYCKIFTFFGETLGTKWVNKEPKIDVLGKKLLETCFMVTFCKKNVKFEAKSDFEDSV